jgi:hypothetical protein
MSSRLAGANAPTFWLLSIIQKYVLPSASGMLFGHTLFFEIKGCFQLRNSPPRVWALSGSASNAELIARSNDSPVLEVYLDHVVGRLN